MGCFQLLLQAMELFARSSSDIDAIYRSLSLSLGTVMVGNWPALRIFDLSANALEGVWWTKRTLVVQRHDSIPMSPRAEDA